MFELQYRSAGEQGVQDVSPLLYLLEINDAQGRLVLSQGVVRPRVLCEMIPVRVDVVVRVDIAEMQLGKKRSQCQCSSLTDIPSQSIHVLDSG